MPLTNAAIRGARPREKSYKLGDGGGLTLLVIRTARSGGDCVTRFGGREKMLSVGVYPDVPLKNARDKRESIRRLIASGIDPSAKREAEKVAQAETFAAIAGEWLDLQRKGFSMATLEKAEWTINDLLNPFIGGMPTRSITAPDILAVLRRLENARLGLPERQSVTNENNAQQLGDMSDKVGDSHVRMSLRLQLTFGLRREEAIKFKPSYADRRDHIALMGSWTKGGRERSIPITTPEQRAVLDQAHQLAGAGSLIPPDKNYIQQRYVYDAQCKAAGTEPHAWSSAPLCADAVRGFDWMAGTGRLQGC